MIVIQNLHTECSAVLPSIYISIYVVPQLVVRYFMADVSLHLVFYCVVDVC
jgi:hypothetical protein